MENIILEPVQQEYTDFMSLPMGVYKNIQYYNNIQGKVFFESNLCKKEGCTYYSHVLFKMKKSKNGYYRQNTQKHGFTLEKGKLSIWYGKNIFEVPGIWKVFEHMNLNWLNTKLMPYVTKGIAEKLLNGKITNNMELVKAYIKVMRLNCSGKLLYSTIEAGNYNKQVLLLMMSVAKDQNHFLEYCLSVDPEKQTNYLLMDFVKQAQILDRKIDYTWSTKRMHDEHQQWTREIMEVEVRDMEDVVAENTLNFTEFTRLGFTLLTTKKEVFAEGKTMNHCLYTNYWSSIKNGNYLAYHIDFFGEKATLGCYISDGISFNQCYGYSNQSVSGDLKAYASRFVEELNQFAKEKHLIKELIYF
jgi:hypothetical protein